MFTSLFPILFTLLLQKEIQPPPLRPDALVEIQFENFSGKKRISPDSVYTNAFGEDYTVQRLKYYITNIELSDSQSGKKTPIEDSYFLIDDNDEASKTISLHVPPGNYSTISFLLGVDSLHNVSGAQTGALDPLNGMFWTWNTGYVSIKIEGRSSVSNLPRQLIEYHLGGYKGPDKVTERVQLPFPQGMMEMKAKKTVIIAVKTDLDSFFKSVHSLPIATNPACTTAGRLARMYAENYATIFSISSIHDK